ncbi:MAG: hypothetical protein ACM338_06910 [Betaproteobacteria bacterium]
MVGLLIRRVGDSMMNRRTFIGGVAGGLVAVRIRAFGQQRGKSWRAGSTSDDWETYRSEAGDFSVGHPANWTVEERIVARGVRITTLMPPSGAAISVIIQSGTSLDQGDSDLMNTRCKDVTVGGRPARTCLDTVSFSLSTRVLGSDRTYIIMGSRRGGDQRIYDRVLDSFEILR